MLLQQIIIVCNVRCYQAPHCQPVFLKVISLWLWSDFDPAVDLTRATMDNNFVIEVFLEACHKEEFQNRWMSAATWAEIVCRHYNLVAEVAFDGNKLVHAISRNKVLNSLMEGNDGIDKNNITVFRKKYRPKGMTKQVYCFYATLKGQRPKGVDASPQWHSNINLATDLLEKKITRRTTLKFESISINESLELKKIEDSNLGKRKRPQTNISEHGLLKAANDSFLDPSSSKEVSSSACIPTPHIFLGVTGSNHSFQACWC